MSITQQYKSEYLSPAVLNGLLLVSLEDILWPFNYAKWEGVGIAVFGGFKK